MKRCSGRSAGTSHLAVPGASAAELTPPAVGTPARLGAANPVDHADLLRCRGRPLPRSATAEGGVSSKCDAHAGCPADPQHVLVNHRGALSGPPLTLPVAVTLFPRDIPRAPRSWIHNGYSDVVHLGEAEKGGHFATLEQPDILVRELTDGLRPLR